MAYEPIRLYRSMGEGFPLMKNPPEAATQTFVLGVPLVITAGAAQECAFGGAEIVYGVSAEAGHNLTVAGTPEELSIGTPPNMPLGRITPIGAPVKNGTVICYAANGLNEFSVSLFLGQVYTPAMIGVNYGLTKDGVTGFWYLDNTDVAGDNVVAKCTGVDSSSPNSATLGARVTFIFVAALRAFQ